MIPADDAPGTPEVPDPSAQGDGQETAGTPGVPAETQPAGLPGDPASSDTPGAPGDGDAAEPDAEAEPHEMTFLEHLQELRGRLVRIVLAFMVGLFACYYFSEDLFNLLVKPLYNVLPQGSILQYTSLPEAFMTYLKVSMFAGIVVTSPYTFYQLWRFVAPGLYESERRWLIPIACISAIFFACGTLFCYFIVFPVAFEFFVGFSTDIIKPMPKLDEYLSFSLSLLLAFGLIFETPLFIFFLARLGLVTSAGLRKKRKYAVLVAFIVAAVLTPTPDAINQCLMAGPLIVFYEIGLWAAHFFGKKRPEPSPAQDETEAA